VRYRVYLWLTRSSQAADVVQEVEAVSATLAVQTVMRSHTILCAYYVWIVPERETLPCEELYQVHYASAQARRR
jgi:hypothetical protein